MKSREVMLASGEKFSVPQGVQRLDSKSTHGWQVRYQGTKYFPDSTAGPAKALDAATKELLRRIATLPAPVSLRRAPSPRKNSDLPAGVSGPILVRRSAAAQPAAVFSVLVPRFGKTNLVRKVHIGTRTTYSAARYEAALARALEIRTQGQTAYEAEATKARRREAASMKKAAIAARRAA